MARIYKREGKKGTIYYVDYVENGKRARKRIGRSKELAELTLKDLEVRIEKEQAGFPQIKPISVEELIEKFFIHTAGHLKEKSTERYREIVSHFNNFCKTRKIVNFSDVNNSELESYKQQRYEKVKPITVNHELTILHTFFEYAKKFGYTRKNPVEGITRYKVNKKIVRFFSEEEIKLILENCTERLYPIFLTLANTGMRKGELLNLEWPDIDFEARKIRIRIKDFWTPKTGEERDVPLNNQLCNFLKKLYENKKEGRWVFSTTGGQQPRHLREDLIRLCKRLNIEKANLHTFRHTFASHLVMKGVDLPTVQKLLGHRDISTTMIYAHLAPNHLAGAVKKLSFS